MEFRAARASPGSFLASRRGVSVEDARESLYVFGNPCPCGRNKLSQRGQASLDAREASKNGIKGEKTREARDGNAQPPGGLSRLHFPFSSAIVSKSLVVRYEVTSAYE